MLVASRRPRAIKIQILIVNTDPFSNRNFPGLISDLRKASAGKISNICAALRQHILSVLYRKLMSSQQFPGDSHFKVSLPRKHGKDWFKQSTFLGNAIRRLSIGWLP